MANINQGPDTKPTEVQRTGAGASADLSTLNVSTPEYMRESSAVTHSHTPESVQRKWSERSLSTGASIQGRRVGGAS